MLNTVIPRRIALVARELYPFIGGGIAPVMAGLARTLSEIADVTIFTTAAHRTEYARLSGPLYGPNVEVVFVDEPVGGDKAGFICYLHAWSACLYEALVEYYANGGPDLIEFPDYLAEGFVTVQARQTAEPLFAHTQVAVRLHTSVEMCSVLNGSIESDFDTEAVFEAERYCLRFADCLLYPGGDVLGTYTRFYHSHRLAPARRVLDAFHVDFMATDVVDGAGSESVARRRDDEPLRLLFLGRFERRKGVQSLVRALRHTGYQNWQLTLLGGDTNTAPIETSMRRHIELTTAGDGRIVLHEPVPRRQVGRLIADHDVVVVPSLWECWPNVVREAFLHNRPVVATPVGGLVEMVQEGVSGWLATGTSPDALIEVLERLFEHPKQVRDAIDAGTPRAALDRIVDPERTKSNYLELLAAPPAAARSLSFRRSSPPPLVSVIIPYYQMEKYVGDTVASVRAQTWLHTEIIIVNDGSFRSEDEIVFDLAGESDVTLVTQLNSGLSAARNLGVSQARGRYVLPLDADDLLEPEFIERCVHSLEGDDRHAYVTTWSQYIDEEGRRLPLPDNGYAPYGNWSPLVDRNNVASHSSAMLRRRLFDLGFRYSHDLTSFEDWFLYRQLHHAGHFGAVIPRRLFLYRIRSDSMLRMIGTPKREALFRQMNALLQESEMQWTPTNV